MLRVGSVTGTYYFFDGNINYIIDKYWKTMNR